MPDVKNIFAVYQNTNEVYLVPFLACLVEKRRNEKEKSLGGGVDFPLPCDAALCRGSLKFCVRGEGGVKPQWDGILHRTSRIMMVYPLVLARSEFLLPQDSV